MRFLICVYRCSSVVNPSSHCKSILRDCGLKTSPFVLSLVIGASLDVGRLVLGAFPGLISFLFQKKRLKRDGLVLIILKSCRVRGMRETQRDNSGLTAASCLRHPGSLASNSRIREVKSTVQPRQIPRHSRIQNQGWPPDVPAKGSARIYKRSSLIRPFAKP